jgi:hypothetical protein
VKSKEFSYLLHEVEGKTNAASGEAKFSYKKEWNA